MAPQFAGLRDVLPLKRAGDGGRRNARDIVRVIAGMSTAAFRLACLQIRSRYAPACPDEIL